MLFIAFPKTLRHFSQGRHLTSEYESVEVVILEDFCPKSVFFLGFEPKAHIHTPLKYTCESRTLFGGALL